MADATKGRNGPLLTDMNGELDSPVLTCRGCKHLNVHDSHYFYCGAQHAPNCDPNNKNPYPWRGAGKRLNLDPSPLLGCPYKMNSGIDLGEFVDQVRKSLAYQESDTKYAVMVGALVAANILRAGSTAQAADMQNALDKSNKALQELQNDMTTLTAIIHKYGPSKEE